MSIKSHVIYKHDKGLSLSLVCDQLVILMMIDNMMRRKESERLRSLTTEQWLKERFRQGYHEMKTSFSHHKNSSNGTVSK